MFSTMKLDNLTFNCLKNTGHIKLYKSVRLLVNTILFFKKSDHHLSQ